MISIDFKNNLLAFIFYGLFSKHTQTNIISGLQIYPKSGVAFRLGRMKNPIRLDTAKNRRIIAEIFMNYPEKEIRDKIY